MTGSPIPGSPIPDSHRDLHETPTAVLGTVGPDGRPQLTAVWYLVYDDGTLRLSLHTDRQKTANLRARPVATLFLIDTSTPTRYLEVRADVELADDPDYAVAGRVGAEAAGVDPVALTPPPPPRGPCCVRYRPGAS